VQNIVLQSAIYLGTMLMGVLLKHKGFFRTQDRDVLSKIILNLTLPAMLVSSFNGVRLDFWFVISFLLGLLVNAVMVVCALVMGRDGSPDLRAVYAVTVAGLNLGILTLPYMQGVLPEGVPYLCMFDVGDTIFTLGIIYAVAASLKGQQHGFHPKKFLRDLFSSVPFDAYVVMVTLSLLHISLPAPLIQAADFIGRSNGFLAMLMVGISLEFHLDHTALMDTFKILAARYAIGVVSALAIFFLLPAPLVMRQILAAAAFSAIPTVSVVYCNKLQIDSAIPGLVVPLTTLLSFLVMPAVLLLIS